MSIETDGTDVEELKAKIAALEQEKNNVVGELKDDRTKRRELEDKVTALQGLIEEKVKTTPEKEPNGEIEVLVTEAVTKALETRKASSAVENKKKAFEKFVSQHKEFNPDNDTTGTLRDALETEFGTFNTAGLEDVEQFEALIGKAYMLLGGNTTSETSSRANNPYSSIPSTASVPKTVTSDKITDKERRLIDAQGWTEERYLKLKEKMPSSYIDGLLTHVR